METEDVVSGKEYSSRLRRQFERLHPLPDWAKQGADGRQHDPPCDETEEMDDPVRPVPSLSELLRSNVSYIRKSNTKLRPESLNILRLADADKNGDIKVRFPLHLSFTLPPDSYLTVISPELRHCPSTPSIPSFSLRV